MADDDEGALALDGGKRPRWRKQKAPAWTAAKEDIFFDRLGQSCNVLLSAKAAGVRPQAAYHRRSEDAKFRAKWDAALSDGYAQLELVMLERALLGVEKVVTARNGDTRIMRAYNDRLGLTLLKMHRDAVAEYDAGVDQEDYQEACERIIARLERLREGEADGSGAAPSPRT